MTIEGLQALHIILLKVLVVRLGQQHQIVGEVEADDIQVKVLLQNLVGFYQLRILLVHLFLYYLHLLKKFVTLLCLLFGHVLYFFPEFDGLLLHGLLLEFHLVLHELDFLVVVHVVDRPVKSMG